VTGVIGLVRKTESTSLRLGRDSLDAEAWDSVSVCSASVARSAFKPRAKLSEEESIAVLSSGGVLELRRGNNEGADIMAGVLGEPGEERLGESRASKYGEEDDEDENSLEDLREDIDLFENNAVSEGRFTLVCLEFCALDSERKTDEGNRGEEGVVGAV
jgi:hypothetical protein